MQHPRCVPLILIPAILTALAMVAGPAAATVQTAALLPGFNFIAPTVVPAPAVTTATLFERLPALTQAFLFDEATQAFRYHVKLEGGQLFGDALALGVGRGIVLRLSAASTLTLDGTTDGASAAPTVGAGFSFRGFPAVVSNPTARGLLTAHPDLQSVFRWDTAASRFDFLLRLTGTLTFGTDFELTPGGGYFLRMAKAGGLAFGAVLGDLATAGARDLRMVNLSPVAATAFLITDVPAKVSIEYAPAAGGNWTTVAESAAAQVHAVNLHDLAVLTDYDFRVLVDRGGFVSGALDGDKPFRFRTSGEATVSTSRSLAGRVVDAQSAPVVGAAAVVAIAGRSTPLMALTNSNGVFLVVLSNLKDASTGSPLDVVDGDELTIDVYTVAAKKTVTVNALAGWTPPLAGTITLP